MNDWVSARGAAAILAGDGISRKMSRRILAAGLAGEPLRTSSATLYDASRVRGLLERPIVDVDQLPPPCDRALLEIRVPPGSTSQSWTRIGNAGAIVRVQLRVLAERYDLLPAVATCCGFVLGGFEVTGALPLNEEALYEAVPSQALTKLQAQPPGEWLTEFSDRRLPSTAGNPWRLWVQPAA